jgi:hypothetical protein
MRRSDFLRELGNSLFETVKSVYEPFLKNDLEKVEEAADRVLGITWVPLITESEYFSELEMKFVKGMPIIMARYGTNMQAVHGICPVCSHIITLSSLYARGKCLNCQKEFNFKTHSGELQLNPLPIKRKDHTYYVGIAKAKRQGEHDA